MNRRALLRAAGGGWFAATLGAVAPALAAQSLPSQSQWFDTLTLLRGLRDPFAFSIHLTAFKDGTQDAENQVDVYFRSHQQVLVLFRAPQSVAGRRILIQGADMWLGMPSSKRVLRILPSQRLLGEASNGDLINTDFSQYSLVAENTRIENQEKLIYLKLVAISDSQTYQTIEYLIDPANGRPRLSRHYAASGKMLKSIYYIDFKPVAGSIRMRTLKLVNPIMQDQYTTMVFDNFRPMDLSEGLFDKNALLDLML